MLFQTSNDLEQIKNISPSASSRNLPPRCCDEMSPLEEQVRILQWIIGHIGKSCDVCGHNDCRRTTSAEGRNVRTTNPLTKLIDRLAMTVSLRQGLGEAFSLKGESQQRIQRRFGKLAAKRTLHLRRQMKGESSIMSSIEELTELTVAFRDERNWKQFYTIKNLLISLNLGAAELLELVQWREDADIEKATRSEDVRARLADE